MTAEPDRPVRIAMLGDSLTEGWGLSPGQALPVVLEEMLTQAEVRAEMLNFGISGETAAEGLERLPRVLKAEPDAVILEFGANDCFLGLEPERTRAAMAAMLERLARAGLPVLVVGIKALADLNLDPEYVAEFDALFPDLARQYGTLYFENILDCFYGQEDLVLLDGVHPNPDGVRAAAAALMPLVRELAAKAADGRTERAAIQRVADRESRLRLTLEAGLIRYCMSPVAVVAASLLLGLLGLVLFQSLWGALLGLLGPALWPVSWWVLRRRHARRQALLEQRLLEAGLKACEATPDEEHFNLMRATGSLAIPLQRLLNEGLAANILVPRPTWVVLARVEGRVLGSGWWRDGGFGLEVRECTEVYLREISHVSVENARLTLHTSGGASIDIQAGYDGEPHRAMDYLRHSLRRLAEAQTPKEDEETTQAEP